MNADIWFSTLRHTYNPWKHAEQDMCERCPEPVAFEDASLCRGCVHARLCRVCRREYEVHPEIRKLHAQTVASQVRANAFIHAGEASSAEAVWGDAQRLEDQLFEATLAWLLERPARNGKTKADAERELKDAHDDGSNGHPR